MDQLQHTRNKGASDGNGSPQIADLADSRLRRSAYLSLQHVSCEFCAGVLTLRGRLPTYYLKQIAQVVVAAIEGVERIDNQIEVLSHAVFLAPGGRMPL